MGCASHRRLEPAKSPTPPYQEKPMRLAIISRARQFLAAWAAMKSLPIEIGAQRARPILAIQIAPMRPFRSRATPLARLVLPGKPQSPFRWFGRQDGPE